MNWSLTRSNYVDTNQGISSSGIIEDAPLGVFWGC